MSTITASLINLTISTPQNGHLSTQPKNPARCPLDPLAQQAKSDVEVAEGLHGDDGPEDFLL